MLNDRAGELTYIALNLRLLATKSEGVFTGTRMRHVGDVELIKGDGENDNDDEDVIEGELGNNKDDADCQDDENDHGYQGDTNDNDYQGDENDNDYHANKFW